jgi:hypothetical protein
MDNHPTIHCNRFEPPPSPPPARDRLWALCRKFVEERGITCPEHVSQCDDVIVNAYQLIEDICEIVGYHEEED